MSDFTNQTLPSERQLFYPSKASTSVIYLLQHCRVLQIASSDCFHLSLLHDEMSYQLVLKWVTCTVFLKARMNHSN